MAETLDIQIDRRGVATVTLTRAEKHNAMSGQMIDALELAAQALGRDPAVRIVVLTGAGPTFCAGGDLAWMRDQMQALPQTRRDGATKLANMLRSWNEMPKPVIARLQGNAFGGGLGLASIADVAIAVDTARFGLTETRLGLIPATIGPYVVARMGAAMARRVFFSSRRFDATEAVTLGLIARAVPADQLDAVVEAEVVPYLACAPGAVTAAKALVRRIAWPIDDAMIAASIDALIAQWDGDEAAEGIAAFFEKRQPSWALGGCRKA
jgi:methylglutaconyl-CoA hydratase